MADKEQYYREMKEITDRLENGIKELFESEKYQSYLKTLANFHSYSTRNTLLIHMQMPNATLVGGYEKWKSLNRQVRRGQKGIRIYAPVKSSDKKELYKIDPQTQAPMLDKDGNPVLEEVNINSLRFRLVPVFDISQTHGDPLPELAENLIGDVQQYEAFVDALKAVSPLPIHFEALQDVDGRCIYGKRIEICEGMSEIQTVSAIIHEITHAKLHDVTVDNETEKDKNSEEVVAESVSYAVCQYFGIETARNSFGYIASWSSTRELEELKKSLDTIRKTATLLISSVDIKFKEILKDRGIEQTAKEEPEAEPTIPQEPPTATPVPMQRKIKENTRQHINYHQFEKLFPLMVNKEFRTMRYESQGYEPLSLEWITDKKLSIMHTYTQNGDLMYDPDMVISIDTEKHTIEACTYELSGLNLYQDVYANDRLNLELQKKLNSFLWQWLKNIEEQQFMPVRGNMEKNYEDFEFFFDKDGKPIGNTEELADFAMDYIVLASKYAELKNTTYPDTKEEVIRIVKLIHEGEGATLTDLLKSYADYTELQSDANALIDRFNVLTSEAPPKQYELGYGHLGHGLTVWNRAEEKNGDYVTIAHIDAYRKTTYYEELPQEVKERIEKVALTSTMTVSASQDTPVFETPPVIDEMEIKAVETAATPDIIMPDSNITIAEMNAYGYSYENMLPLTIDRALEIYDLDITVYTLYPDNSEAMVFERDEIIGNDCIYGIGREDWEKSAVYQQMKSEQESNKDSYSIYQLKSGEKLHYHRFTAYDELKRSNLTIDVANYNLVYSATLDKGMTLDNIYEKFNINHPPDFKGHSLSISDVVVLNRNNETTSHYVDSIGFKELLVFLGNETFPTQPNVPMEKYLANAETGAEQNYNQIDGIINNDPTVSDTDGKESSNKGKPSILLQLQENKKTIAKEREKQIIEQKNDGRIL